MNLRLPLLLPMLAVLCACSAHVDAGDPASNVDGGTPAQQKRLVQAAKPVLSDIDHDHYVQLWQHIAPMMRARTTEQSWADNISTLRAPLGAVTHRRIKGFGFTTHIDNAPDGHYGVIALQTTFQHAGRAEEKLVFMRVHGHWDLVGYFLTKGLYSLDMGGHPSDAKQRDTTTPP